MRRILTKAAAALALLLVLAAAGVYLYLIRSLPVTAGTIQVSGLSGPVEIIRDAEAVPHIFAATRNDALFGLGYVHAQDRLWQMEFQRRVGHGRLSEIFGSATLREDRFLRTVGFGRAASAAWNNLPEEGRIQVESYVAGVNAFIRSHGGSRLPPEFSLLRFAPEPWSGPDVLAWVKMMAWDLSANYSIELLRRDLAGKVGVQRMQELLPPYPPDGLNILTTAPPTSTASQPTGQAQAASGEPVGSYAAAYERSLSGSHPSLARFLLGGGGGLEALGSNNWVVDGTLTASGRPLLANDPHLGAQVPSLWYLAHMSAGDFDVIGATLPGTPAVAIGRNRFIAWGETNMFADVEDLYRERLDEGGTSAEFRGTMEPLTIIDERIQVKNAPGEVVKVRISRHGPLVSDAINANNAGSGPPPAAVEPLAFRWTALDDRDDTLMAFLKLNDARNWQQFTDALRDFVVPSQNFVYADVDGHIGYYAPGHVPVRSGGDGLMPAEGWTGDMEWSGWIPFDELPHVLDPPAHFIVTANNRPVPPEYGYYLAYEYHEPFRAQRITDLLSARTGLTPDDFRAMQADTFSPHAGALLPLLLRHVRPAGGREMTAVDLLKTWNFDATADAAAPAIFEAWFLQLAPRLAGDELGPEIGANYARRFTFITRFVTHALTSGSGTFCDDVRTPAAEDCDGVVTAALRDGLDLLSARMGADISNWRWGTAHRAVFAHQGFDTVLGLHWLLSRSIQSRGDWSSINVGAVATERPYDQTDIPGYRQIVDLSSANDSRFLGSVGQSGHFLSPHFDDELTAWRSVRHHPMRTERIRIEAGAIGRLRLVPAP